MVGRARNGRFLKKSEEKRRSVVSEVKKSGEENSKKRKANSEPITEVGRRIVDITLLANEMWCSICDSPLHFKYLEKEVRRGLASIFHIRCSACLEITTVCSSNVSRNAASSKEDSALYPVYSVNCKAALGCIDSGCGHEQLNCLLTALNIPPVSHHTLKLAEKRVGAAIEERANLSCQQALELEKTLTVHQTEENSEPQESDLVDIVVQYDFGWNKRGNGKCYNSHSGHGSVIGHLTKKVIAFASRSRVCAMCAKGHDKADHDCRQDWDGTAKGMEPDTAAKIIGDNKNFAEAGVRVGVLVGDEDASTRVAVQQKVSHTVEKWIDRNHNIKRFQGKLYAMRNRHKFLNTVTIKYLTNLLATAIDTNQGHVENTRQGIQQVLHHVYGEHDKCGDWCRAKGRDNYHFARLPGGRALSCPSFKMDLQHLLQEQKNKAHQIAPGGTSQQNESFNHMVATRAPKSRHYAGTSANHFRVSSAVCQKNIGCEYVVDVNRAVGLSPGGVTAKYRRASESRRVEKASRQGQLQMKKRRLFLKNQHASQSSSSHRREGLTYVGGMGNTMERAAAAATVTSWMPQVTALNPNSALIYVDLETTGFGAQAEIVQIAAKCQDREFSEFMLPSKPFNAEASAVTGLSIIDGHLVQRGSRVTTKPSKDVAEDFLSFLRSCGEQVIMVGHNIIRFDAPLIVLWLKRHNLLAEMCNISYGFCDTLPLVKQGKVRKQEDLARLYLTTPEWVRIIDTAHCALADVRILCGLVEALNVSPDTMRATALSSRAFFEKQAAARKKKDLLPALACLRGIISQSMLGKMASQGVTIEELRSEFLTHGDKGVEVCLGVQVNGKPRVTRNKKIVQNIVNAVRNL